MSLLLRLLIPAGLVAAVVAAFAFLQLESAALLSRDGLTQMTAYASGFMAPDLSPAHLQAIARGTLETLAMSAIGTLLAALFGLLLALPAAGRFGLLAQAASRLLLNALRAIPELVWAALMVLAAGLGPNAGTLALALHTAGVLGRLFAEALENTPPQPADALRLAGSGRIAAFCYGTLPSLWPQLVAYTLYRWENNIRAAAVLGVVGAGGLGQLLSFHMGLFQMGKTATILAAMLLLVAIVDSMSYHLRRTMTR